MTACTVLIVEDDPALREALEDTLAFAGIETLVAGDGGEALTLLAREPVGLIVSDVEMAPVNGWELLRRVKRSHPGLPVLLMTAYGTVPKAVAAMRDGATDYLAKPFDAERLVETVQRYLPLANAATANEVQGLVASDPLTLELLELARRFAANEATIMVTGESGTGKEVFARFIHAHSTRRRGPFVAINCAAIPNDMLEAMLFGYEKGAFTGAHVGRAGKFEQAQSGTLLLDEIAEMDLGLQAKLLRVLQEREVERLGGSRLISLDVRVLATTNRDLRDQVTAGRFREDLYYRLNVLPLELPPLRSRRGDVLPLFRHFLQAQCGGARVPPLLSDAAAEALLDYGWPGNVRELENLVQRTLVLTTGDRIEAADLRFESSRQAFVELPATGLGEELRQEERHRVFEAIRGAGSRKAAAEALGISPRTLRHKLARWRAEGHPIPGELDAQPV